MPADIEALELKKKKDEPVEKKDDAKKEPRPRKEPVRGEPNKGALQNLKESKWLWPVLILIIVPFNILMIYVAYCFASVLVAFGTFGIPYLLGVRKAKKFLVLGTVVILFTGIIYGGMIAYFLVHPTAAQTPAHDDSNILTGGIVTPYNGNQNTVFEFKVTLTYNGTYVNNSRVNLYIYGNQAHPGFIKYTNDPYSPQYLSNVSMTRGNNGLYSYKTNLEGDIYNYAFRVTIPGLTNPATKQNWTIYDTVTASRAALQGPVTRSVTSLAGEYILLLVIYSYIYFGLLFYVLVGMYWWTQRAKHDREKYLERVDKDDTGGKPKSAFTCSSCGADVGESAAKCPKCGESFEDDDSGGEKGKSGDGKKSEPEKRDGKDNKESEKPGPDEIKEKAGKKNW